MLDFNLAKHKMDHKMISKRSVFSSIVFGFTFFVISKIACAIPMVYTFESEYASLSSYHVVGFTGRENVMDLIGLDPYAHVTWKFIIDSEVNADWRYDSRYLSGAFFDGDEYNYKDCQTSVPVQDGYIDCAGKGVFFDTNVDARIKIGYETSRPRLEDWVVGLTNLQGFNLIGDSIENANEETVWLFIEWNLTITDIRPYVSVSEPPVFSLYGIGLIIFVVIQLMHKMSGRKWSISVIAR